MGSRVYDNDEFVRRISEIHPTIELLSQYTKSRDKVKCRCKLDNYEWYVTANNLLKGKKCPRCTGHIGIEQSEVNNILLLNNLPLSSIQNGFTSKYKPSLFKCKICSGEFEEKLSNILRREFSCPYCEKENIHKSRPVKIKKAPMSEGDYRSIISEINHNIILVGEYHSSNPTLHKCLVCGHEWNARVQQIKRGGGCPECSRKSLTMTHDELLIRARKNTPYLEITGRYNNSKDRIPCLCKVCGYSWYSYIDYFRKKHNGCPVCERIVLCDGINSLFDTRHDVALMLKDISLSHKYMSGSNYKAMFVCPDCGEEKMQSIVSVCKYGVSCSKCGDGISYPNKYMYSFLSQLGLKFQTEVEFQWSNRRRYDFYIPSSKTIIEVHGVQHYKKTFGKCRSLEEELANDVYKADLAASNGISEYIVINAMIASSEYISTSIKKSLLSSASNFQYVDFDQCHKNATSSYVKKCCALRNSGLSIKEIASDILIGSGTVRRYLKQGLAIGLT